MDDGKPGRWVVDPPEVRGLSADEVAKKLASPNKPVVVYEIRLPEGVNIQRSVAGPQPTFPGSPQGGGYQILVPDGVKSFWIRRKWRLE